MAMTSAFAPSPSPPPTVHHLFQLSECPIPPHKPLCGALDCLGPDLGPSSVSSISVTLSAAQPGFQCAAEAPPHTLPGTPDRLVTLALCYCCPGPQHVPCSHARCAAVPGTDSCTAIELQGCRCVRETSEEEQGPHRPDKARAFLPSPDDPGGVMYVNPDRQPVSNGTNIMRMLAQMQRMGVHIVRDEAMQRQLGLPPPAAPRDAADTDEAAGAGTNLRADARNDTATRDEGQGSSAEITTAMASWQYSVAPPGPTSAGIEPRRNWTAMAYWMMNAGDIAKLR